MKSDGSNLPVKQDGRPVFISPDNYERMVDQLKGTPSRISMDVVESSSLNPYGVSISGLDLQSVSPHSSSGRQVFRVEEFQAEKYKEPILEMSDFPNNEEIRHSRKGLWPHLYKMAGGSKHNGGVGDPLLRAKDKLIVSVRETSRKEEVNTWNVRHLKSKHIDERGRVYIDALDGKSPNSESALLPQDARMKILSTSSFSQFFGKKAPKGKDVMYGHLEGKITHDNGGTLESDMRLSSSIDVVSDVQVQLLQQPSSGIELETYYPGVNLREWLKPGNVMKNKAERLRVFCQIVELVGLAHSQGIVLQHLRPSYFILTPSNKLKYIGSVSRSKVDVYTPMARGKKRPLEEDIKALCTSNVKQPKLVTDTRFQDANYDIGCSSGSDNTEHRVLSMASCQTTVVDKPLVVNLQLEEKWYACPEDHDGNFAKLPSNIYCLGVLLFEVSNQDWYCATHLHLFLWHRCISSFACLATVTWICFSN